MTVLIILLCVFNLVMWLVAIVKFKKIFSTDDVLEKTRHELNNMMMEINRNAERNIDLIEDRVKKLKDATAEADRHLEILRGELQSVEKSKVFQARLMAGGQAKSKDAAVVPVAGFDSAEESVEEKKSIVAPRKSSTRVTNAKSSQEMDAETQEVAKKSTPTGRPRGPLASYQYELNKVPSQTRSSQKKKTLSNPVESGDDFSKEIDDIVRKSSFEIEEQLDGIKSENEKKSSGSEMPEIIVSPNPIRPKKSKKDQVLDLADTGMTVDEIAQRLRTTTTEVQFILDMA